MFKNIFITSVLLVAFQLNIYSQSQADESVRDSTITSKDVATTYKKAKSFKSHLRFGGSFQASFSDTYTSIGVAPSVLYDFQNGFYAGLGFSYYYTETKNSFNQKYSSNVYGGSVITLYNLLRVIQLSAEFEQLKVNNSIDDFWVSGLYLGAAYRARNISVGFRYDVLFDEGKSIYGESISPVIRIYF